MIKFYSTIIIFICTFFCSLIAEDAKDLKIAFEKLEEKDVEITNLCTRCLDLDEKLSELQSKFYEFKIDIEDRVLPNSIALNFKEDVGVQEVVTSSGRFFISSGSVNPYLDGYKVVINIGNPYSCTFHNPNINVAWVIPYKKGMNIGDWLKSRKEKEHSFITEVKEGTWTKIELPLTPCTVEELENVRISINFRTIAFKKE